MFCKFCGASNPNSASFCGACGRAIATTASGSPLLAEAPGITNTVPPPEPPQPGPRGGRSRRAWIGILAVILLIVVIARILSSGPKPEDSLDQARLAYLQHDQETFDKHVDVQSVLSGWTDEATDHWLQKRETSWMEGLVVKGSVGFLKSKLLPSLSESVDRLVVTGTWMQDPASGGSGPAETFIAGLLSSGLHTLVSSQLTYQGVASKSISGKDALLGVNVQSPLSSQPLVVKIKLRKDGRHWRVVGVPGLVGLLQQLGYGANP